MPRQLLQSHKSPFLGSGTIIPFFQSVETSLSLPYSVKQLRQVWYECFSVFQQIWLNVIRTCCFAILELILTARATSVSVIASIFTSSVGVSSVSFSN